MIFKNWVKLLLFGIRKCIYTRVVAKVPLHSLLCHNNRKSALTTLMVTNFNIEGFLGQISVLLRAFVKEQWRFQPLYPYCSGAGLLTLPLIMIFFLIFSRLDKCTTNKKSISKLDLYLA